MVCPADVLWNPPTHRSSLQMYQQYYLQYVLVQVPLIIGRQADKILLHSVLKNRKRKGSQDAQENQEKSFHAPEGQWRQGQDTRRRKEGHRLYEPRRPTILFLLENGESIFSVAPISI